MKLRGGLAVQKGDELSQGHGQITPFLEVTDGHGQGGFLKASDSPLNAYGFRILELLPRIIPVKVRFKTNAGIPEPFSLLLEEDTGLAVVDKQNPRHHSCSRALFAFLQDGEDPLEAERAADSRNVFTGKTPDQSVVAAPTENRGRIPLHNGFIHRPRVVIHAADKDRVNHDRRRRVYSLHRRRYVVQVPHGRINVLPHGGVYLLEKVFKEFTSPGSGEAVRLLNELTHIVGSVSPRKAGFLKL